MAYGLYGRQFFIQGGNKSDGTTSIDFYRLDLNVRWNTSSPVWSSLPSNGMAVSGVSGGFLSSSAFVVHSNSPPGVFSYSMPSQTWTRLVGSTGAANGGPQVVTTMTDNRTYFLTDGFSVDSQGANLTNFKQRLGDGSAAVWSPRLGKVLSAGTNSSGAFDIRTLDLSSAGSIWTSLNVNGPPIERQFHCFVPVDSDPTSFLLYGGRNSDGALGDLWLLNLSTAMWTPLPSGTNRHSMACAVSGDSLVVWGGYINTNNQLADTTPLLYNLTTKKWGATQFIPGSSDHTNDGVDPRPTDYQGKLDSSGPNVGAIVGGVVGGVVVIALAGFCFYRRRTRGRGKKATSESRATSSNDSSHAAEKQEFMEEERERGLPSLPPAQPIQEQHFVLPRGGSPTAALGYPTTPVQPPPPPMHSRPMTSQSYVASTGHSPVPVNHSQFEDLNEASAKHPLLTPVQYTPTTQHQPRPQDNEVVDLMPITRSEAGSLHSRTNSVSSRHSLGRRTTLRTTRSQDDEEDEDPEELDYL